MIKKLSISLSSWVVETYLSSRMNKSRYIEEMIIKGSQIDSGEFSDTKQKIIALAKDLRIKDDEISQLKLQIGSLKNKFSSKREMSVGEKMAKAYKNKGLWS